MILNPSEDPLGHAISNFFNSGDNSPITVTSTVVEDEQLPPDYFFRTYNEMPLLERIALKKCEGKILDIGAGAGCHSLFLQEKGKEVTSLEISSLCCEVLRKRGINKVINEDIFNFHQKKFNTLLLLMNGIGIAGTLDNLRNLLEKLKKLLTPDGVIFIDSSDLIYLHQQPNGSLLLDLNPNTYYGEIQYHLKYKKIIGQPFSWLFADYVILGETAEACGLKSSIVEFGPHYDYLAELKVSN